MKTVIVGANHAGIAAANTLLDNYKDQQVVMIDRNTNLSYLGCGTALWVGRQIDSYENLFYTNKEAFEAKGARIYLETSVTSIDFANHVVHCQKADGTCFDESYDKLVLATGSLPISPKLPGCDLEGISFLKLFQQGQEVDRWMSDESVRSVAVIGAGYIGVEIAEAAKRRGKEVRLFDIAPTSLASYYDPSFTAVMDENLASHGIECHFGERVVAYHGENGRVSAIEAEKGTYPADLVINAIGFIPNNELGRDHLELFANGAYHVDRRQRTSDPDVYAIGDIAEMRCEEYPKGHPQVAQVAIQMGRTLAHNLNEPEKDQDFRYRDKGSMATVGRNRAVVVMKHAFMDGYFAWLAWMCIHLISLLDMRNRIMVLINWVWNYLTYATSLRLLIRPVRYPERKHWGN